MMWVRGLLSIPSDPQQCPATDGRANRNCAMDGAFNWPKAAILFDTTFFLNSLKQWTGYSVLVLNPDVRLIILYNSIPLFVRT